MNLFISHSNKDSDLALKIAQELSRFGVQAWVYEKEISAGEGIISKVEPALENADYVLVILSKAALHSGWVRRETHARLMSDLAAGEESIILILTDDVPVPPLLRSVKWVDFRASFAEGMEQLKERI